MLCLTTGEVKASNSESLHLAKRARNDEEKKEEETAASTMVDTTRFEKHFSFVSPMVFSLYGKYGLWGKLTV
jgi:hypothetical protein